MGAFGKRAASEPQPIEPRQPEVFTPKPEPRRRLALGAYSGEQLASLSRMKDPNFRVGVARMEFVNNVLWPDGSIDTNVRMLKGSYPDLAEEIDQHVGMYRFLFIPIGGDWPIVYFQCATKDNPDIEGYRK